MLDILSNMTTQTNPLGAFLQAARDAKGLTLRAVEQATGISNAYLSQLESGKIKQPSPVTLHKLSALYDVSYADLLTLTGYPLPRAAEPAHRPGFASRIGPVTNQEESALMEYLQFLRSRRKKGGRR